MVRVAVCALTVALVLGCQPGKEIPTLASKGPESNPAPALPTASEPAAKAYIEKAAKAMSGGKPDLLAKGKVSRAVFKGRMYLPNQPVPAEVTRTIAAVWPDRLAVTNEMLTQGARTIVIANMHRPRFVTTTNGEEKSLPNVAEVEHNFAADEAVRYGMCFLLPATDPRAIVFDFRSTTGQAPGTGQPMPIHLVKLLLGDFPVYQLTFDAKTDLLLRMEYTTREQGVTYRNQWTVVDRKLSPEGLLLPAQTKYLREERQAEQFEMDRWEFPASIPDTEFDALKK
jgi:hypothetical protein